MGKKLLILAVFSALCILVLGASAHAAGTASGVIITAESSENYVEYTDLAGNLKAPVYGPTLRVTVLSIYGLAKTGPGTPDDQTTDPSVEVYYVYEITNSGNTTDSYALRESITYTGGNHGAEWTVQFYLDANTDGVPDGGPIDSITLSEDAPMHFLLKVLPSATAESGSRGTVTVTAETAAGPAGEYTGANGDVYGGPAFVNDATNTDIQAPTVAFTRVATIDAPSGSSGYTQGSAVNPVPGSVVTITMTYSNEGTASSESNIIIDRVPAGHTIGHINCTGGGNLPNVAITPPAGTAIGWMLSYTTEATISSGRRAYGNTDGWVSLGEITNSTGWVSYMAIGTASTQITFEGTYLKWEKDTIASAEAGQTLTWGYIIR